MAITKTQILSVLAGHIMPRPFMANGFPESAMVCEMQKLHDAYEYKCPPHDDWYLQVFLPYIARMSLDAMVVNKHISMEERNEFPRCADSFVDLLMYKNQRYGNEPITRWGMIGVVMKIDAKVSRMKNMMNFKNGDEQDAEKNRETLHDTLTDILGYCVLGILLCQGELR